MSILLINKQRDAQIITINRADKLNALNKETIRALSDALKKAENDPTVKAVIITGAGEKAFIAGADISEFKNYSIEQAHELSSEGQKELFNLVEELSKPVIAAINGFALGGGLELAMACHIRIASENARMGLPEVSLGLIPGYGGTQRLAQLAGKGKAFELIFTAGMIRADEAQEIGLVNYVVTQVELIEKCLGIVDQLSKNSSLAIASAIRSVNSGYRSGVNGYEKEIEEFANCFATEDFKEGTAAFLEKRKADFPNK